MDIVDWYLCMFNNAKPSNKVLHICNTNLYNKISIILNYFFNITNFIIIVV